MKKLQPIHILILFLSFLTLWSAAIWNGTDPYVWLISLRSLALIGLSGFLVRLAVRTFIEPSFNARHEHRIITTLILFLLFDPFTPWWVFVILGGVTEAVQYFFRTQLGPLFNPAAFGALGVSIFGFLPSWWGVNPEPRLLMGGVEVSVVAWITALGAAYVIYRYRKLPIAFSALVAAALGYFVFLGENPSYFVLEGTLLFFVFIMVCEPKTSPVNRTEQIIYGFLVGLLMPLGLSWHFLEASLIALLLGNLYAGRRFLPTLFSSFKKSEAPPTLA